MDKRNILILSFFVLFCVMIMINSVSAGQFENATAPIINDFKNNQQENINEEYKIRTEGSAIFNAYSLGNGDISCSIDVDNKPDLFIYSNSHKIINKNDLKKEIKNINKKIDAMNYKQNYKLVINENNIKKFSESWGISQYDLDESIQYIAKYKTVFKKVKTAKNANKLFDKYGEEIYDYYKIKWDKNYQRCTIYKKYSKFIKFKKTTTELLAFFNWNNGMEAYVYRIGYGVI